MLATESPLRDLESIIRSRTPLIAVESNEEPQIVRLVRDIGARLQLRGFRWTVTEGLQAFDPNDQPHESIVKSQEVLSYIRTAATSSFFVLLDFHPYLAGRRPCALSQGYRPHLPEALFDGGAGRPRCARARGTAAFHRAVPPAVADTGRIAPYRPRRSG